MKLLLDAHAFIWWFSAAHLLSNDALAAIQDSSNSLHLSAASVWEIQIKTQLGKLTFAYPLQVIIEHQKQANNLRILNIEPAHIYALDNLPLHHKVPFDRLIIAQSVVERLTIISDDTAFTKYGVSPLW